MATHWVQGKQVDPPSGDLFVSVSIVMMGLFVGQVSVISFVDSPMSVVLFVSIVFIPSSQHFSIAMAMFGLSPSPHSESHSSMWTFTPLQFHCNIKK